MIDIMGEDPSVTPAQLCHGHKVYRGVDLGVSSSRLCILRECPQTKSPIKP